jgi:hypothetical protein
VIETPRSIQPPWWNRSQWGRSHLQPHYAPNLPVAILESQVLSDAQLETLIYAGDAFQRDLPGRFHPARKA